jgi:hypothetical protein
LVPFETLASVAPSMRPALLDAVQKPPNGVSITTNGGKLCVRVPVKRPAGSTKPPPGASGTSATGWFDSIWRGGNVG